MSHNECFCCICVPTPLKLMYTAGCGVPDAPVNGSVSGFIEARVGAQVTYSCDPGLELVGKKIAVCTHNLLWEPSTSDVVCVQPLPGMFVYMWPTF